MMRSEGRIRFTVRVSAADGAAAAFPYPKYSHQHTHTHTHTDTQLFDRPRPPSRSPRLWQYLQAIDSLQICRLHSIFCWELTKDYLHIQITRFSIYQNSLLHRYTYIEREGERERGREIGGCERVRAMSAREIKILRILLPHFAPWLGWPTVAAVVFRSSFGLRCYPDKVHWLPTRESAREREREGEGEREAERESPNQDIIVIAPPSLAGINSERMRVGKFSGNSQFNNLQLPSLAA